MNAHERFVATLNALALLVEHEHVDDAVDALVADVGWDAAFITLASITDEPRTAEGLYSLVCSLFLDSFQE